MSASAGSATAITNDVYKWVIDEVVARMKPEVVQEGLDESFLDELRVLWQAKLMEKGLLDGAPVAPEPAPPPAPIPGMPGLAGMGAFTAQLAASIHPGLAAAVAANAAAASAAAANAAAAGVAAPHAMAGIKREAPEGGFDPATFFQRQFAPVPQVPQVPQVDGPGDDEGGEEGGEAAAGEAEEPASDEQLSSDSEEEESEDEDHKDFLCCQFEKVGRAKNKWKIAMKEGVFHINGKDYLFKKAQGEWIF